LLKKRKIKKRKLKKENDFLQEHIETLEEKVKESKIQKSILTEEVMKEIQRLGGQTKVSLPRKYLENVESIPESIQFFIDIEFKENISCSKYSINDFEFISEYGIDEKLEYPFLLNNPDHILLGWGPNHMIGARQFDKNQDLSDFNIYVLNDDQKTVGPIKLSKFLKECK